MLDADPLTVAGGRTGVDDGARHDRVDRGADRGGDVDTGVEGAPTRAVTGGEHAFGRAGDTGYSFCGGSGSGSSGGLCLGLGGGALVGKLGGLGQLFLHVGHRFELGDLQDLRRGVYGGGGDVLGVGEELVLDDGGVGFGLDGRGSGSAGTGGGDCSGGCGDESDATAEGTVDGGGATPGAGGACSLRLGEDGITPVVRPVMRAQPDPFCKGIVTVSLFIPGTIHLCCGARKPRGQACRVDGGGGGSWGAGLA